MKYGVILHNYGLSASKAAGFNIGDPVQSIILEKIYDEMGIPEDEINRIDLCEINTYDGEYTLLPMAGVALGVQFATLPLSPKIIPVFISAHFVISELSDVQVRYLQMYAPIGCRDEYSLNVMRRYNIPAYLSGCITTLFPQREANVTVKKIYAIDIPESLKAYIPAEWQDQMVYDTHLLPIENSPMSRRDAEAFLNETKDRLDLYKNTAKLMISSRMHALVPCMAMGIPVIAAFDNLSYRFSWLDRYIPLYTEDNFAQIDWNPDEVNLDNAKINIKELVISTIRTAKEKYDLPYKVSQFYETRKKSLYGNRYRNIISKAHLEDKKFEYVIWGCGLIGNSVYEIMQEKYPQATLKVAVDQYMKGTWHEVPIITPDHLVEYPECFIILSTYSGKEQGEALMKSLGKKEFEEYVSVGTING